VSIGQIIIIGCCGIFLAATINHISTQLPSCNYITYPKCSNCLKPLKPTRLFAISRLYFRNCICGYETNLWTIEVLLEVVFTIVMLILAYSVQSHTQLITLILLLSCLTLIAKIDAQHKIIFNSTLHTTGLIALLSKLVETNGANSSVDIITILLPGFISYIIMLTLFVGGKLYKKLLMSKHDIQDTITVLGMGDVKLGLVIGIITGWSLLFQALLLGIFINGIVALSIFTRKNYKPYSTIPFGTSMILSTIIIIIINNR